MLIFQPFLINFYQIPYLYFMLVVYLLLRDNHRKFIIQISYMSESLCYIYKIYMICILKKQHIYILVYLLHYQVFVIYICVFTA